MRPRKFSLRSLISALVAVVFAIAAEPGVMAMPAPQAAKHTMTMDCSGKAALGCNHMKPQKDPGTPCKNMAVCAGMLNCFGMAAVAVEHPSFLTAAGRASVHVVQQTALGRTLQPDNPPPIA